MGANIDPFCCASSFSIFIKKNLKKMLLIKIEKFFLHLVGLYSLKDNYLKKYVDMMKDILL